MKDNRVLLGFSGGIDSFAAVGLLQAAGYHVTALTLDMRGDSALLEKARLRAGALGIPWRMRSVRERFEREDPAWAPAAGQPVVLYRGERVVGGGILERYY